MSRLETLPDHQRAVLQILLRQRKRYDELSKLLSLDPAAVRRRAHEALAALGPDGTEMPADRRDDVADYLLGQDDESRRIATYDYLGTSPSARAWARVVAGELRELAPDTLPAIPGEGGDDTTAAPAPAPAPAAAAAAPAATGEPASRLPERRSSRLGGALLLGGIALAAIVAALVLFVFKGDDSPKADTAPAASTTAAQGRPQVEAQVNLVPPSSRKGLKALGVVLVQRAQSQSQIVAAVQGLPKPKNGGYGIWLYTGPGKAKWLGFFASRDSQGRLLARGVLTVPIGDYREVLVTREAKGNPPRPGPIFLRGPVQAPSAG
jgi:anti-sigma-K factor RskA